MTDSDYQALAEARTRELLARAARHYGIPPPDPELRFDLRGRGAGQVLFRPRGPTLIRYNAGLLGANGEAFLARTVPHEVAHLIARRLHGPRVRPHGPEWRAVMGFFGADPSRCHAYDTRQTQTRQLRQFAYRCACRRHLLTSIRHRRVLAGQRYLCRGCGEALAPEPVAEGLGSLDLA